VVFKLLLCHDYPGNFILQTARADDGRHAEVLSTYFHFTRQLFRKHSFLEAPL
jgi:hypothetical protein